MMTKTILSTVCLAAVALQGAESFSSQVSRREAFTKAANTVAGGIATTVVFPNLAFAEPTEETPRVTTRMGGLLVCSPSTGHKQFFFSRNCFSHLFLHYIK